MHEYHFITSSYPTLLSKLFHLSITFVIGIIGWNYNLNHYISTFIILYLIIIIIWILALSNLYPFHLTKSYKKTDNQNILNDISNISNLNNSNINISSLNTQNISNTSSINQSFSFMNSSMNESYFYSPQKDQENINKQTVLNKSLPFNMTSDDTIIFDDDNDVNNGLRQRNPLNISNSIINFNELPTINENNSNILTSVSSMNEMNQMNLKSESEMNKMISLSEPTNCFQIIIGFSSVYCCLNYLNIFDENKKKNIINTMTKQNYFNISSFHFASMIIDLFSYILIPFFVFHIFLLYQSQYSMIPVCYVLIIIYVSQNGEFILNLMLSSFEPQFSGKRFDYRKKSILSSSISSSYSLEGLFVSIIISLITSSVLYISFGLFFYRSICLNNNHNQLCNTSFVQLQLINHLILSFLISIQSIFGSLLSDIIMKSYAYKLNELYKKKRNKNKKLLIYLQRFSSFIFAFPITFYYLQF